MTNLCLIKKNLISLQRCSQKKGKSALERWVSGLNQQFAKLSYGKLYRGFESPSLRQVKLKNKEKPYPPAYDKMRLIADSVFQIHSAM